MKFFFESIYSQKLNIDIALLLDAMKDAYDADFHKFLFYQIKILCFYLFQIS